MNAVAIPVLPTVRLKNILYTTDFSKPITGRTACCCSHRSEIWFQDLCRPRLGSSALFHGDA
jgi:hypothetical protein